jgi:hypothetical protein
MAMIFVLVCRYVATSVTSVHHDMENGFNIWSFNGKLLYRTLKDHFFQVRSIVEILALINFNWLEVLNFNWLEVLTRKIPPLS